MVLTSGAAGRRGGEAGVVEQPAAPAAFIPGTQERAPAEARGASADHGRWPADGTRCPVCGQVGTRVGDAVLVMRAPVTSAMGPLVGCGRRAGSGLCLLPRWAHSRRYCRHAWRGQDLLVPEGVVSGLAMAVDAVLATAAETAMHGSGRLGQWGPARLSRVAACVYVDGPVRAGGRHGYEPARTFFVALRDLRGLRVRLTAYLDAPAPR